MTYSKWVTGVLLGTLSLLFIISVEPAGAAVAAFVQSTLPAVTNWVAIAVAIAVMAGLLHPAQKYMKKALDFITGAIRSSDPVLRAWVETLSSTEAYASIAVMSALTLFLELALINWQASLFPVFALYKNFTLLACFFGLGIGYASVRKGPLGLVMALPLLASLLLGLTALHAGGNGLDKQLLFVVPVQEEASVFAYNLSNIGLFVRIILSLPVYGLLAGTFIINALLMMPLAQFCGLLMERAATLKSYGSNLAGSLLGIVLLFILSLCWAGPAIWFGLSAMTLLWFVLPLVRQRGLILVALAVTMLTLSWPASPLVHNIYSPYQLIQRATTHGGLMKILSAGSYFQKVFDFGDKDRKEGPGEKAVHGYYDLPFHTAGDAKTILVVGAGSGNDVAAALRSGATHVDAVEIDPVIIELGRLNHPERPYTNPAVNVINDDARNYLRNATTAYDAIVYGVLDAHILLSHGANVRLDSFVYTQEGLRDAFKRLAPGGLLSVAFALPNEKMGQKIYRMLTQLEGTGKPVVVRTAYDNTGTATFMVRKGVDIAVDPQFLAAYNFKDISPLFENEDLSNLDLPVDDWPFFYMEARAYPVSYLVSMGMVLLLSFVMARQFLPGWKWKPSLFPFFFLGSGFMLLETKAITELGLTFGNTWYVIGVVIIGVLGMAFLANLLAASISVKRHGIVYFLLLVAIGAGLVASLNGGLALSGVTLKIGTALLLTCPLFFSGLVFSALLKRVKDINGALAYNIIGAMLGGVLEYNSMRFGFSSLYLLALVLYALAWASSTTLFSKMGRGRR